MTNLKSTTRDIHHSSISSQRRTDSRGQSDISPLQKDSKIELKSIILENPITAGLFKKYEGNFDAIPVDYSQKLLSLLKRKGAIEFFKQERAFHILVADAHSPTASHYSALEAYHFILDHHDIKDCSEKEKEDSFKILRLVHQLTNGSLHLKSYLKETKNLKKLLSFIHNSPQQDIDKLKGFLAQNQNAFSFLEQKTQEGRLFLDIFLDLANDDKTNELSSSILIALEQHGQKSIDFLSSMVPVAGTGKTILEDLSKRNTTLGEWVLDLLSDKHDFLANHTHQGRSNYQALIDTIDHIQSNDPSKEIWQIFKPLRMMLGSHTDQDNNYVGHYITQYLQDENNLKKIMSLSAENFEGIHHFLEAMPFDKLLSKQEPITRQCDEILSHAQEHPFSFTQMLYTRSYIEWFPSATKDDFQKWLQKDVNQMGDFLKQHAQEKFWQPLSRGNISSLPDMPMVSHKTSFVPWVRSLNNFYLFASTAMPNYLAYASDAIMDAFSKPFAKAEETKNFSDIMPNYNEKASLSVKALGAKKIITYQDKKGNQREFKIAGRSLIYQDNHGQEWVIKFEKSGEDKKQGLERELRGMTLPTKANQAHGDLEPQLIFLKNIPQNLLSCMEEIANQSDNPYQLAQPVDGQYKVLLYKHPQGGHDYISEAYHSPDAIKKGVRLNIADIVHHADEGLFETEPSDCFHNEKQGRKIYWGISRFASEKGHKIMGTFERWRKGFESSDKRLFGSSSRKDLMPLSEIDKKGGVVKMIIQGVYLEVLSIWNNMSEQERYLENQRGFLGNSLFTVFMDLAKNYSDRDRLIKAGNKDIRQLPIEEMLQQATEDFFDFANICKKDEVSTLLGKVNINIKKMAEQIQVFCTDEHVSILENIDQAIQRQKLTSLYGEGSFTPVLDVQHPSEKDPRLSSWIAGKGFYGRGEDKYNDLGERSSSFPLEEMIKLIEFATASYQNKRVASAPEKG